MKKEYKELYRKIDEILWNSWDPIGINDNECCRDEYASYTPYIVKLKLDGTDVVKIANHLCRLETVDMGITGNNDLILAHCKEIAQKIVEL